MISDIFIQRVNLEREALITKWQLIGVRIAELDKEWSNVAARRIGSEIELLVISNKINGLERDYKEIYGAILALSWVVSYPNTFGSPTLDTLLPSSNIVD